MTKIQKTTEHANLPRSHAEQPERTPVDPELIFRGVCAQILRDPVSSATDKLRAVEAYMRFRPEHQATVEELTRAEVALLTTEQLDELLGVLTHPLHQRDRREVERELEQRTAVLEASFEERVAARVRELVDVEAVEARIEQRARAIAAQGRPLAEVAPSPEVTSQVQPSIPAKELPDWPPDRQRPRRLLR